MTRPPFFGAAELAAANVTPLEGMAAIEAGLAALGREQAQQPPPPALSPGGGAFFQPLAASLPEHDLACVNWLTFHPANPAAGLPHSGGLLILNAFATGAPLCIMDGLWVSHRRTGYIAGLGAKYLAGEVDDVALIGPGAIAADALDAFAALGLLRSRVRVCGRRAESARAFAAETRRRLGVETEPMTDPRAAVAGVRLVVTATSHAGPPFLERDWIAEGAILILIDRLRVITPGLLARADRIVANSRESLAKWGVDPAAGRVESFPAMVAAGCARPAGAREVVLYDAGGLAVADLALAALLWERLRSRAAAPEASR
jgi:alanine dehydrogenase